MLVTIMLSIGTMLLFVLMSGAIGRQADCTSQDCADDCNNSKPK